MMESDTGYDCEVTKSSTTKLDENSKSTEDLVAYSRIDYDESKLLEETKEVLLSHLKKSLDNEISLESKCQSLLNEIDCIKASDSKSTYEIQIEELEKQLSLAKSECLNWKKENFQSKELMAKEALSMKGELTSKLESIKRQYEAANRDKESMVIKYAMAEKEVIIVKKQKENVEKKVKELEKDKEILQGKIKSLSAERSRICNTLDNKIQENGLAVRTIDKLKEELNSKDIKIKWGQTKMLTETAAHKELQAQLDRALNMISNHEEEIKLVKMEAEKVVKETKMAENTRESVLDQQLKEAKANLIMETQKSENLSKLNKQLRTELETIQRSLCVNTNFKAKMPTSTEKMESENCHVNLSEGTGDLSQLQTNLTDWLRQLESEKLRADIAEENLLDLKYKLEEQITEMDKCRVKEAELLAFTQKLTDKNVILQSQLTAVQGKARLYELEHGEFKSNLEDLKSKKFDLQKELNILTVAKREEELRLNKLLEERNIEVNSLKTKVSDLLNEILVLQKKHTNYTKDSSREIQKLRKKLDIFENQKINLENDIDSSDRGGHSDKGSDIYCNGDNKDKNSPPPASLHDTLSQESRTSSDTSLNFIEGNSNTRAASPQNPSPPIINDLPQNVLIERIIKLQKIIIKKSEKMEFLEEHVEQLVSELKKKKKIIFHYIMNAETGALSNAKSDSAKAAIMKHGGIMASVYGSALKDETMTLELSLEINRKLQGVLEDTLLKNITLKENLNTLGDEVAKLTIQNSHTSGIS